MKILSSTVAMQSQHTSVLRTEERETLRVSVAPPPATPPVAAAPQAVAPQAAAPQDDKASETTDSRLLLIKAFVEWLTGRPVKLFDASQLENASREEVALPDASAAAPTPPRAGFSLEYEYHATREEVERTDFAAQGVVTTADGRRIDFSQGVEMARSYSEHTDVSVRTGDAAQRKDPLVLNFAGTAAELSGEHMTFDLDADGKTDLVPLLSGGSVYLALDRNLNGRIDSGSELFGPSTGSGFSELAQYDSDGNHWIDESDPVFRQLTLWQPAASGDGQLYTLQDRNVGALYLGQQATPFELRGTQNQDLGAVRATGIYLAETGEAGSIQQIDLTA